MKAWLIRKWHVYKLMKLIKIAQGDGTYWTSIPSKTYGLRGVLTFKRVNGRMPCPWDGTDVMLLSCAGVHENTIRNARRIMKQMKEKNNV